MAHHVFANTQTSRSYQAMHKHWGDPGNYKCKELAEHKSKMDNIAFVVPKLHFTVDGRDNEEEEEESTTKKKKKSKINNKSLMFIYIFERQCLLQEGQKDPDWLGLPRAQYLQVLHI
jgi:hypothetical protein